MATAAKNTATANLPEITQRPDYWRQLDVFDPDKFQHQVHIIGVGATGSWIANILAKIGVNTIHAYDFDRVELHNLPNQIYGLGDVGKFKVDALAERLRYDCGTNIIPHNMALIDPGSDVGQKFASEHAGVEMGLPKLSGIVYLCTDTMSSRKQIWEQTIKYKLDVSLMVETRLGAEMGIVHTVRPFNPTDVRQFEQTMFDDSEGEQSPCTYRAISTTVVTVAGLASHKLIKFAANEPMEPVIRVTEGEQPSNYDLFAIRPVLMTTSAWAN